MSQHDDRKSSGAPRGARPASARQLWGGVLAAGLLAALVAGGAILSVPLVSAASGWWARSGHWGHHGEFDPERARERAEFAAGWVLRLVDASEEQEQRVSAILGESVDDLVPLSERHRQNRAALMAELARPRIDRGAIEEIRAAELELADVASRKLVETFADIAEVLTPEQRAELIELAERFHR
jgi:Spy/CpxP family protein refolding chaperone